MSNSTPPITEQLRRVLKDAIDYFHSVVNLIQARFAELALSGVVFVLLMTFSFILILGAFLLLNVALGIWLAHALGSVGLAVLLLAILYLLVALLSASVAMRWLNKLKS